MDHMGNGTVMEVPENIKGQGGRIMEDQSSTRTRGDEASSRIAK